MRGGSSWRGYTDSLVPVGVLHDWRFTFDHIYLAWVPTTELDLRTPVCPNRGIWTNSAIPAIHSDFFGFAAGVLFQGTDTALDLATFQLISFSSHP